MKHIVSKKKKKLKKSVDIQPWSATTVFGYILRKQGMYYFMYLFIYLASNPSICDTLDLS